MLHNTQQGHFVIKLTFQDIGVLYVFTFMVALRI